MKQRDYEKLILENRRAFLKKAEEEVRSEN
jgi:hypothetical protein